MASQSTLKMALTDTLQDKSTYASMTADCTQLIDNQVAAKGGLSGVALKTAYRVIKGIGNDYIKGAVRRLLPETLSALNPMWAEGLQQGDPVLYLSQHSDRTADVILSATDARIERNGGGVVEATYKQLRKSIKRDVVEAVPHLAEIIGKHASSSTPA